MLTTPEGFRLYYALEYIFKTSNNEAKYEAVLGGLRLAKALGVSKLRIRTDSRLVVGQLKGEKLKQYKEVTQKLLREFEAYEIDHVPRAFRDRRHVQNKAGWSSGLLDPHLPERYHRATKHRRSDRR